MSKILNAPQVVAHAICFDALRRVQASGEQGIWGEELKWHLKCWGTDAYAKVVSEIKAHCAYKYFGSRGYLFKASEQSPGYLQDLAKAEEVSQLVNDIAGPLPDLKEQGSRIVGAFQEAMRLHRLPTSVGTSTPMDPISELLNPLFGGMLLGHMFCADHQTCRGITYYCQEEDHAEAPFGVLCVRFDSVENKTWVTGETSNPNGKVNEVLVDDALTLGELFNQCRLGGWASTGEVEDLFVGETV